MDFGVALTAWVAPQLSKPKSIATLPKRTTREKRKGTFHVFCIFVIFNYIVNLRNKIWDRFSVRFSNSFEKLSANSQDLLDNKQGIICPEQLDKTKNCANCGLCWNNNIDNIIFKTH